MRIVMRGDWSYTPTNREAAWQASDVEITEAAIGPLFRNLEGATLGVCQRDDGWELEFHPADYPDRVFSVQMMHGGVTVVEAGK